MTVSIVTQTCVRPESAENFARWQGETSTAISALPGFIEQRLIPPRPPLQVDWVILQRFATLEDARRWLVSPERQRRIEGIAHMLVGRDDVHIVEEDKGGRTPSPASAVISTRVLPGKENEYRAWERKIAMAQSRAPGLQGYRFEPPVPGIQDDFVAILRFDSEANLRGWLDSPERKQLIAEAAPLTEEFHTRMARTGFEQWFREDGREASQAPAWKMSMVVLLLLYPIVFLFGLFVDRPFLVGLLGLPFAVALFVGNAVSVPLLGWLVPRVGLYLGWWLKSGGPRKAWIDMLGAALILSLYAAMVLIFACLF